jgi:hypothetical protein
MPQFSEKPIRFLLMALQFTARNGNESGNDRTTHYSSVLPLAV